MSPVLVQPNLTTEASEVCFPQKRGGFRVKEMDTDEIRWPSANAKKSIFENSG